LQTESNCLFNWYLSASSSGTASSCVAASNPQCACICVRTDDFSFSKQRFHAV
jgi:hypothetical protein